MLPFTVVKDIFPDSLKEGVEVGLTGGIPCDLVN